VKLTPSTAVTLPYFFVSPSTEIIASQYADAT